MKNLKLNPGGIIGGLLAALVGALVMFSPGGDMPRWVSRAFISVIFGGGIAGNWFWSMLYPEGLTTVDDSPEGAKLGDLKIALPKRVFRASRSRRWMFSFTLLPLGALLIVIGAGVLFSSEVENKGISVPVILLMGVLLLTAWLWLVRLKLEIGDDAFHFTGMLGTKDVLFSDVAGYRIETRGLTQAIKLTDGTGYCLGRIHSYLAGFPILVSWVEQRFVGGNRDE